MVNVLTDKKDLERAAEILEFMRTDPIRIARMVLSNSVSLSEGFVAHGEEHAQDVFSLVNHIIAQTELLFPGTFTSFYRSTAGAGALMHDIGRSVSGEDHDKHGAVITHAYLLELAAQVYGGGEEVPDDFRARVVSLVRRHRSNSWLYKTDDEKSRRQREIDGPDIAALLLADKLCGSEVRVPPAKIQLLTDLARIRIPASFRRRYGLDKKWSLARINWNNPKLITEPKKLLRACEGLLRQENFTIPKDVEIDAHDRVNGSIKHRTIEMFSDAKIDDGHPESSSRKVKGTMVFRIKVDERLAPHELVTGLDWWHDAFHVAAKSAKYLGFRFCIVFNDRNLVYNRQIENWEFVETFEYKS